MESNERHYRMTAEDATLHFDNPRFRVELTPDVHYVGMGATPLEAMRNAMGCAYQYDPQTRIDYLRAALADICNASRLGLGQEQYLAQQALDIDHHMHPQDEYPPRRITYRPDWAKGKP